MYIYYIYCIIFYLYIFVDMRTCDAWSPEAETRRNSARPVPADN